MAPPSKSVPYPPASIWKTKEEGASFEFRGNAFARRGNLVSLLTKPAAQAEPDKASEE